MARDKIKVSEEIGGDQVVAAVKSEKMQFPVWFSTSLKKFEGMEAHHFHAVQAFLLGLGFGEKETPEDFEKGVLKFGYKVQL